MHNEPGHLQPKMRILIMMRNWKSSCRRTLGMVKRKTMNKGPLWIQMLHLVALSIPGYRKMVWLGQLSAKHLEIFTIHYVYQDWSSLLYTLPTLIEERCYWGQAPHMGCMCAMKLYIPESSMRYNHENASLWLEKNWRRRKLRNIAKWSVGKSFTQNECYHEHNRSSNLLAIHHHKTCFLQKCDEMQQHNNGNGKK